MRYWRRISPIVLLAACLWLPAESEAGYDTAFLTLMPSASTPPFTWAHSYATATPPPAEQESIPPSDPPALPDPDESPQNALISKTSPVTVSRPSYNAAWSTYIDRFIIPSIQAALSTQLTKPLPLPTLPQDLSLKASSPEPFIEIVILLEAASPYPPIAMHVQLLVPEKTILRILREATGTASISENAPAYSSSSDRIQHAEAFQAYLDSVSETLKDEATVQQYFRTASTTSSIISVMSTLGQIIALGTLPLHAVFTTIPMLLYYAVNAVLGEEPLNRHWKLFSSASNSLLRTTFSDTLIPVP
ncbi:MAG: hypothetical protein D4R81_02045 [Nitrospiraceae bacterium]|nr:MAG: hypothetical protein D4R81_02045 [Nitrospiraceae bacterium]